MTDFYLLTWINTRQEIGIKCCYITQKQLSYLPSIFFIRFFLQRINDFRGSALSYPEGVVSFEAFVEAVLDGFADEHWAPMMTDCGFCHVNYDAILKFENLNYEQSYFLRRSGLDGKLSPTLHENRGRKTLTKMEKMEYFGALDSKAQNKLLAMYNLDFEAFKYNPREFF